MLNLCQKLLKGNMQKQHIPIWTTDSMLSFYFRSKYKHNFQWQNKWQGWDINISLKRSKLSYLFQWQVGWYLFNLALSHRTSLQMESSILKYEHIYLHTRDVYCVAHTHSWVNLVVPKNWGAYFSAISGRKFDLTTVLRSCWHIEWRRRGFIASGPFFSLLLMRETTFQWSKVVSEAIFPTN